LTMTVVHCIFIPISTEKLGVKQKKKDVRSVLMNKTNILIDVLMI